MVRTLISGLIGFAILYLFLKMERISPKSFKWLLTILLLVVFPIVYWTELQNNRYREKVNTLTLEFMEDKNITCGNYIVNSKTFNITSNSFVAKKNSKFKGVILPFTTCQ